MWSAERVFFKSHHCSVGKCCTYDWLQRSKVRQYWTDIGTNLQRYYRNSRAQNLILVFAVAIVVSCNYYWEFTVVVTTFAKLYSRVYLSPLIIIGSLLYLSPLIAELYCICHQYSRVICHRHYRAIITFVLYYNTLWLYVTEFWKLTHLGANDSVNI